MAQHPTPNPVGWRGRRSRAVRGSSSEVRRRGPGRDHGRPDLGLEQVSERFRLAGRGEVEADTNALFLLERLDPADLPAEPVIGGGHPGGAVQSDPSSQPTHRNGRPPGEAGRRSSPSRAAPVRRVGGPGLRPSRGVAAPVRAQAGRHRLRRPDRGHGRWPTSSLSTPATHATTRASTAWRGRRAHAGGQLDQRCSGRRLRPAEDLGRLPGVDVLLDAGDLPVPRQV